MRRLVALANRLPVPVLLHPPGYSYFAMLRQKLHWSATPRH